MLRNFHSPFDATVVQLLRSAGADIIGKANCDEFGMGSLNVYSVHGPVVNPHEPNERRSAGGSSGGSAAAVAAGMCDVWGVVSFADSLDCVGIMARSVKQVQRVFGTLGQYDYRDPSAATPETREKASQACSRSMQEWLSISQGGSLQGLRIGIPQEYFPAELSSSITESLRHVIDALQSRGAQVIPVSLPSTPYALSAYYVIASAEASSNMARYDGVEYGLRVDPPPGADTTKTANVYALTRSKGFGKEVQRRILLGAYALTADAFDNYFLQAQRVRKLIRADFNKIFHVANPLNSTHSPEPQSEVRGVHVLLHPSAIRTAPPLDDALIRDDGLEAYVQDVLTVPASLAGLPALNVPAGLAEDGWPVGVSVVAQWGCDEMAMEVGKIIQEIVP
ncbi:unnamed protein product [Somion occarium]|uniref:Glutamyl-tRNA(Gln) amidotransferase subunit A, mitochondrial n=1 Tax=Somion occarium TaxID=3059160 RepID=A0ABP1E331_9APHY